ncbi:unnamed protein product [Heligmosomoides polygyrus]|uniref:T2SS-T3SS_pil_N domain-containing protein n=1 Tax=Heligmosomoides polygyrus TaxID=6339 RepID=A0A3P8BZD4_HELPZ|nr:unnamed protein product [Heligmosomoides polygyrus]
MAGSVVCMPPPAGLNLKPAKAVGGEQPKVPLSDAGKKDSVPTGSQTLILTKNRKYKKLPSSANYGVNPVLQTNFVDAHGRVLKNVVSIPIRVGDAQIKQVSNNTASAALVEGEAENGVHIKFGQAPPIRL